MKFRFAKTDSAPAEKPSDSLDKLGSGTLDDPLGVLENIPDPDAHLSEEERKKVVRFIYA